MSSSGSTNAATWFLRKLATTPAAWIGLSAGIASGIALASKGPLSGAIGFGTMTAFVVGFMTFVVTTLVKTAHQQAVGTMAQEGLRSATFRNLEKAGLDREKSFLAAMMEDRELIVSSLSSDPVSADATSTLSLVDALIDSAFRSAEELADLSRRSNDPHLDTPKDGAQKMEAIKEELEQAFRAVADARSELREQRTHRKRDPLDTGATPPTSDLAALTGELHQKTRVSGKVRERLQPEDFSGTIVMENPPEEADSLERESESS